MNFFVIKTCLYEKYNIISKESLEIGKLAWIRKMTLYVIKNDLANVL